MQTPGPITVMDRPAHMGEGGENYDIVFVSRPLCNLKLGLN